MIVYFSASARNLKQDLPLYKKIVSIVYALGHTLARDWVEPASFRVERDEAFYDIQSLVRDAQAGVESAEIMIAEVSGGSAFGVGFEVAMALQRRKPVLLLIHKKTYNLSYASGLIYNDLITISRYDDSNIQKIIENFIRVNVLTTKDLRFNFVVDRQIYNHLRARSYQTGKTKAEVVRELLLSDIEKQKK